MRLFAEKVFFHFLSSWRSRFLSRERLRISLVLFFCIGFCFCVLAGQPSGAEGKENDSVDVLFWNRKWQPLNALVVARSADLSPRELSVAANALWLQRRYGEAMELFRKIGKECPRELHPYMEMLFVLGEERSDRKQAGLERAKNLWETAPQGLKYYVAYALARLERDLGNTAASRTWFRQMVKLGDDKTLRKPALDALLAFPEAETSDVLRMLDDYPMNRAALKLLGKKKNLGADALTKLGYAAYVDQNYAKAAQFLQEAEKKGAGERARFWHAFSLYRMGKGNEGIELWRTVAVSGDRYAERAVKRLDIAARNGYRDAVLSILSEVAEKRTGRPGEAAAYYLMRLQEKNAPEKALKWREKLLQEAPRSFYAAELLWEDGWRAWLRDEWKTAARFWEQGLETSAGGDWPARFLYWSAEAQERIGDGASAARNRHRLGESFPTSVYTFWLNPQGSKPISDDLPPVLQGEGSLLEQWGFVTYARIQLGKSSSPKDRFHAARIARWQGDIRGAYHLAGTLAGLLQQGKTLPRELLEMLYPRPHEKEILTAAQRFGVDPHLLWAVMRQESAFDPNATSYVGAMGLMQLMPATAKGEAKGLGMELGNAYKPETNILLGTAHLSMNLKRFDAVEHAVAAYNAGGGAVKRWLENGRDIREWAESVPYEETNGYVRKVMANHFVYSLLYAGSAPSSGENGGTLQGGEASEAPSEVEVQEFVEEEAAQE